MIRFIAIIFVITLISDMVNGRLVDTDNENGIVPEVVARCRATCIDKFLDETDNMVNPISDCNDESNCSMCWDFCQFLYLEKRDVFKNMCDNISCVSRIFVLHFLIFVHFDFRQ